MSIFLDIRVPLNDAVDALRESSGRAATIVVDGKEKATTAFCVEVTDLLESADGVAHFSNVRPFSLETLKDVISMQRDRRRKDTERLEADTKRLEANTKRLEADTKRLEEHADELERAKLARDKLQHAMTEFETVRTRLTEHGRLSRWWWKKSARRVSAERWTDVETLQEIMKTCLDYCDTGTE